MRSECPTSFKNSGASATPFATTAIDYGDYIEQITYLLFLKMADERGVELPEGLRVAGA